MFENSKEKRLKDTQRQKLLHLLWTKRGYKVVIRNDKNRVKLLFFPIVSYDCHKATILTNPNPKFLTILIILVLL